MEISKNLQNKIKWNKDLISAATSLLVRCNYIKRETDF